MIGDLIFITSFGMVALLPLAHAQHAWTDGGFDAAITFNFYGFIIISSHTPVHSIFLCLLVYPLKQIIYCGSDIRPVKKRKSLKKKK